MIQILKSGMVFKNMLDAADFIKYSRSKKDEYISKALSHYCLFHINDNGNVIVDEAFEEVLPFDRYKFEFEVGEKFSNEFGEFEIIDRYIKTGMSKSTKDKNTRIYKCICKKHNTEFELTGNSIKKGVGCPICGRRRVRNGESVGVTHPHIVKYLYNKNDANEYTSGSGKKVLCVCPNCGLKKNVIMSNLARHGFSCDRCGDGLSYPNKFIHTLLDQLNIEHIREHSFEWSNKKIYDQYLPSQNMIIENMGSQHYVDKNGFKFEGTDLQSQIENDEYKKSIAEQNGIEKYIVLDCRESKLDFIKDSVMKSDLPYILGFEEKDIDWEECHKLACHSIMVQVWDEWNKCKDLSNLINKFGLSDTTLRTYIHNGNDCGQCDPYVPQYNNHALPDGTRSGMHNKECSKPLYCSDDDVYFATRFDCEEYYGDFFPKSGSQSLYQFINKGKTYKGKHFKYITKEEFNELKTRSLTDSSIKVYGDYFKIKEVA